MRKWTLAFIVAISVIPCSVWQAAASESGISAPVTSAKTVFLISIPGLSFAEIKRPELQGYPQLEHLVARGQIGAMNIRTPFKGIENTYLTMGAGNLAISQEGYVFLHRAEIHAAERAAARYARFNGLAANSAALIIPEISAIRQSNAATAYHAVPGLLGEALEQAGITLAVWGNRDRGAQLKRSAPLLLMNERGEVGYGALDHRTMLVHHSRPYASMTNYDWILRQIAAMDGPAVHLIELGDLERLYAEKSLYSPQRFLRQKSEILLDIDRFIGKLVDFMTADDSLLVFSPEVHQDAVRAKSLLAPLIWYEHGSLPGLLTSNTTRRLGIISQLDVAPAVLQLFEIPIPKEMIGFPLKYERNTQAIAFLSQQLADIVTTYRLRAKLLYALVVYQLVVLLLGLFLALQKSIQAVHWMKIPLLSLLISPVILLYLTWLYVLPLVMIIIIVFFIMIVLAAACYRLNWFKSCTLVSLVTVILILMDGIFGAEWMKRSVLGYDPMIGARYYGIGNEYMGILIGAAILFASLVVHGWQSVYPIGTKLICAALFCLIVAYLSLPMLGTNAGGAITAMLAFGVVWLRLFAKDWLNRLGSIRQLSLLALFVFAAMAILWVLNQSMIPAIEQQSHIGRAIQQFSSGNAAYISGLIRRKLAMNWHLLGVSIWGKVFVTSLLVIAILLLRPQRIWSKWQQMLPAIMSGYTAIVLGALVALLVNDSGIVAAATMMMYVTAPMLMMKLQERSS